MRLLTLPLLVFAGQIADGLAYQLAVGHGTELGMLGRFDPLLILGVKIIGGLVLMIGALALVRRGRTVLPAWMAIIGFVGCLTELLAVA